MKHEKAVQYLKDSINRLENLIESNKSTTLRNITENELLALQIDLAKKEIDTIRKSVVVLGGKL